MSEQTHEAPEEDDAPDTSDTGGGDEIEERARRAGWVDKDEYRGDPDEWVPAEEWLNYTPAKLRKENKALERQIGAMKKSLDVVAQRQEEMRQQAYEDALKDIRERQKAAAQDGDMETYEQLDQERQKLKTPDTDKKADSEADPNLDPALSEWAEKNQWIVADDVNLAEAHALARRYERQYPDSTLSQRLEMITKEMNRRYGAAPAEEPAERGGRPPRPSMAESSARGTGRSPKKTTKFADLAPEEKEAVYEMERRQQIGKHDGALFKSRDEYAQYMRKFYEEDTQ